MVFAESWVRQLVYSLENGGLDQEDVLGVYLNPYRGYTGTIGVTYRLYGENGPTACRVMEKKMETTLLFGLGFRTPKRM